MDETKAVRTNSNTRLMTLYMAFAWIFPVLGLFIALNSVEMEPFQTSKWTPVVRLIFFFLTAPVYLVYLRLVLLKTFPYRNKDTVFIFIPLAVVFISYGRHWQDGIGNVLVLDALPLFLGINIILLAGLFRLAAKNLAGNNKKLLGLPLLLALIFVYLMPVIFFAVYGWKLNDIVSDGTIWSGNIRFVTNIALVVIFNSKTIKTLYQEGQL